MLHISLILSFASALRYHRLHRGLPSVPYLRVDLGLLVVRVVLVAHLVRGVRQDFLDIQECRVVQEVLEAPGDLLVRPVLEVLVVPLVHLIRGDLLMVAVVGEVVAVQVGNNTNYPFLHLMK